MKCSRCLTRDITRLDMSPKGKLVPVCDSCVYRPGYTKKVKKTTPKTFRKSNPRMVKIYDKITRIEGQKGKDSNFPGEKFFHNFSKPYPAMYGTPDRKTLIIKKG